MSAIIPKAVLSQHIAVLGKTGSGKTSTAKLAIEQVVADGARVCVLDPIKSDWWGLTSSADGKRPGLPFHILGGPHGHVPLHSAAGKAIADVVASSALPLSIVDMADFEPGGQARFFVDFAPALLRKMRGVVYLVIEEAHLFAPKERSGIGAENLSIHWAKTLATAGRSKGVRLVLVTQRTQALHNALLGSCDTLIAHRLTAPADQDPVVKWLKANTTPGVQEMVAAQLSSLKTGAGWLCSGEAKIFERIDFPRIKTYDNTATPTGDGETREIKTAAVNLDKLTAIIGQAVEQAKADDPKELKKKIVKLEYDLATTHRQVLKPLTAPGVVTTRDILTDADRALLAKLIERVDVAGAALAQPIAEKALERVKGLLGDIVTSALNAEEQARASFLTLFDGERLDAIRQKIASVPAPAAAPSRPAREFSRNRPEIARQAENTRKNARAAGDENSLLGKVHRAFLTVLANRQGKSTRRNQLAVFSGYSATSRHVDNTISALRTAGYLAGDSSGLAITPAGLQALGPFEPLPTGSALIEYWIREVGEAPGRMLRVLVDAYPNSRSRNEIAEAANYSVTSRHVDNSLSYLRTLELIEGTRGELHASEELFS